MSEHKKLQIKSAAEYRWIIYSSAVAFFLLIIDQLTKLMVE